MFNYCVFTFICLFWIASSMIVSSDSPNDSLDGLSDFSGSIKHVVNSSSEFANDFSSSTSGRSSRATL